MNTWLGLRGDHDYDNSTLRVWVESWGSTIQPDWLSEALRSGPTGQPPRINCAPWLPSRSHWKGQLNGVRRKFLNIILVQEILSKDGGFKNNIWYRGRGKCRIFAMLLFSQWNKTLIFRKVMTERRILRKNCRSNLLNLKRLGFLLLSMCIHDSKFSAGTRKLGQPAKGANSS